MNECRLVRSEHDGAVTHVILDRPEAHNAVTYTMMLQLIDALDAAESADILVLRAAGGDFTLGRDQSERPAGVTPAENLSRILEVNDRLRRFGGISVGLIRGRALGFGSGLALHCDITIASETAVFGFDEIIHGFPPLIVETYLTEHITRKAALDLVLTGRHVPAAEALALGIVSRVVGDGELDAIGDAVVTGLREANVSALRRAKAFLSEIGRIPAEERGPYGVRELVSWRQAQR